MNCERMPQINVMVVMVSVECFAFVCGLYL